MPEWITWPQWVGTPSQVGLLLVVIGTVLIAYIKVWPVLLEARITERHKERQELRARITELEKAVEDCRRECDRQTALLQDEIGDLQETIYGMRRQHVQEQISLINAIIESVDNPVLKKMLGALESVRSNLPGVKIIPGAGAGRNEDDDAERT